MVDVHPVGLHAENGEPVALSGEVLVVGRAARVPISIPAMCILSRLSYLHRALMRMGVTWNLLPAQYDIRHLTG